MYKVTASGLVFILFAISSSASAQTLSLKQSVPHITTSGAASAEVVPDEALISLGIMIENLTAPGASQEMATAATAVIAEVKAQGVDARDIKTTTTSLTIVYDDERDQSGRVTKHVQRGYQANETFGIRITDVAKTGKLAQSLIAKGANRFDGITFASSKEREIRRKLKAEAMRDAQAEAETYTDAIGLKLGRVIQIGSDPGSPGEGEADMPSRRPLGAGKAVSTVVIPVEPGVQTIVETISVTWEIESRS